jgi:hypothetical protein
MIPPTATGFVYAYQCVDGFTPEQTQALDEAEMTESDDISFVSLGGFIYLDSNDLPVGVRAIRIHSVRQHTNAHPVPSSSWLQLTSGGTHIVAPAGSEQVRNDRSGSGR